MQYRKEMIMIKEDIITLSFKKSGYYKFALIVIILDAISTFLIAKNFPAFFIGNEMNKVLIFLFYKIGYYSFIFLPIALMLVYAFFIEFCFFMIKRDKILKEYAVFLFIFMTYHLFVTSSNFLTFYQLHIMK